MGNLTLIPFCLWPRESAWQSLIAYECLIDFIPRYFHHLSTPIKSTAQEPQIKSTDHKHSKKCPGQDIRKLEKTINWIHTKSSSCLMFSNYVVSLELTGACIVKYSICMTAVYWDKLVYCVLYTFLFNPLLPHIYQVWQITFLNQHCDQVIWWNIEDQFSSTGKSVWHLVPKWMYVKESVHSSPFNFSIPFRFGFLKGSILQKYVELTCSNSITKVKKRKLIIQWFIADIL